MKEIKEHKYKAGQYLRNKISGNICKCHADTSFIDENIWEAWTPKEGEWCWFYNDEANFPLDFVLDKFLKMSNWNDYITDCSVDYFTYCKPFIGELPVNDL